MSWIHDFQVVLTWLSAPSILFVFGCEKWRFSPYHPIWLLQLPHTDLPLRLTEEMISMGETNVSGGIGDGNRNEQGQKNISTSVEQLGSLAFQDSEFNLSVLLWVRKRYIRITSFADSRVEPFILPSMKASFLLSFVFWHLSSIETLPLVEVLDEVSFSYHQSQSLSLVTPDSKWLLIEISSFVREIYENTFWKSGQSISVGVVSLINFRSFFDCEERTSWPTFLSNLPSTMINMFCYCIEWCIFDYVL